MPRAGLREPACLARREPGPQGSARGISLGQIPEAAAVWADRWCQSKPGDQQEQSLAGRTLRHDADCQTPCSVQRDAHPGVPPQPTPLPQAGLSPLHRPGASPSPGPRCNGGRVSPAQGRRMPDRTLQHFCAMGQASIRKGLAQWGTDIPSHGRLLVALGHQEEGQREQAAHRIPWEG